MQAHGAGTPALRLPHQERRRIPRVIQIPPFQLKDLGNPQASAPHDERRGAGLMPVVGRQRVEKTPDLVGRPVVRNIHGGTIQQDQLCQKRRLSSIAPFVDHALERQKWQTLSQTLPPAASHQPTAMTSTRGAAAGVPTTRGRGRDHHRLLPQHHHNAIMEKAAPQPEIPNLATLPAWLVVRNLCNDGLTGTGPLP